MMPLTPIEDIRSARRRLAAKFGNDLTAIVDDLRRQQRESDARFVTRTPRRPQSATNHAMQRSGGGEVSGDGESAPAAR